jgi:peptidoglycan/LPS O-acetylase OafA/YrhL
VNAPVRLPWLDLVRGLAALEVCANHVRRLLLLPYSELPAPSWLDKLVYLSTAFAHQAVVIFFVLSGYFVAGSVAQAHERGSWSWSSYAIQRLSRLWSVLLPCLLLTGLWDTFGSGLSGGAGYNGLLKDLMFSAGENHAPLDGSFTTFIGNFFFLQTIKVDMFGSNLALWSLANEFWYYAIFPLLFLALARGTKFFSRVLYAVLAIALCWQLPWEILKSGLVWLFGYAAWWINRHERWGAVVRHPFLATIATVGFLVSLSAFKSGGWIASDFTLGACFCLLVPSLGTWGMPSAALRRLSTTLSDISYSLYLSHLPLLTFIIFGLLQRQLLSPAPLTYTLYFILMLALLGYGWLVWFCFEKRTPTVRNWMKKLFIPSSGLKPEFAQIHAAHTTIPNHNRPSP